MFMLKSSSPLWSDFSGLIQSASTAAHPIMEKVLNQPEETGSKGGSAITSGGSKTKLAGLSPLPRLTRRNRGSPNSSSRLRRVSVLLCDRGGDARWIFVWHVPPPILYLSKCHHFGWCSAGQVSSRGWCQFATIQLQLQISSSTWGFEAIQIWWLLRGSRRGEAESWALHWYALFTYCLCVHLLMWREEAAPFHFGGHTGSMSGIAIIQYYPPSVSKIYKSFEWLNEESYESSCN